MAKADKVAELERQYKEQLAKIEAEEDDGEPDGDIIILKGNASKAFVEHLKKIGYTEEEAEEKAEEVEEEVEEEEGEEVEEEEEEKEKPKGKSSTKKAAPEKDPKPPSMHRYFSR